MAKNELSLKFSPVNNCFYYMLFLDDYKKCTCLTARGCFMGGTKLVLETYLEPSRISTMELFGENS